MKVINNERVICFDVDGTLIMPVNSENKGPTICVYDPYEMKHVFRTVHNPHLKLLKNYVARGAQVIVWSKNGYLWAESVLTALGLSGDKYSEILVLTKPFAVVDDEPIGNWIGEHVFIPPNASFGNDEVVK